MSQFILCQKCGVVEPCGVHNPNYRFPSSLDPMTAPPSPIPLAERLREMAVGMDKEGRCLDVEWGDGDRQDNGFHQAARMMVEAAEALTDLTARAEQHDYLMGLASKHRDELEAEIVQLEARADQAEAALAGLREGVEGLIVEAEKHVKSMSTGTLSSFSIATVHNLKKLLTDILAPGGPS